MFTAISLLRLLAVAGASFFVSLAMAQSGAPATGALEAQLADVQTQWANVHYQVPQPRKEAAFKMLAQNSGALVQSFPARAEAHIWHGIVLSSWAGARGGLGALDLVKQARSEYEQALAIDRTALQGSALASLGVLYFKVPGWPLGFGDDEKAETLLKEALSINPEGIDPNYFYADFLLEQGKRDQARTFAQRALNAKPRAGRELADQGRRDEARTLLDRIGP